jgi:predicted dienelactone hydrolase
MKQISIVQLVPIACAALLQGCFGGSNPDPGQDGQALSNSGAYEICSYEDNLDNDDYRSARMSYPCDLSDGPYPSTTLTGGFTNTKEQMYWLADHLTTHGYIVLTLTPTNSLSVPPIWRKAHIAGFEVLAQENNRWFSPIRGKVDLNNRNIMGYSMGGGGAILAAEEMTTKPASMIALAPWLGAYEVDYSQITVPSMIIGAADDIVAVNSEVYYPQFRTDIERGLAMISDTSHLDFINTGDDQEHERIRTMVTAFLEVQLKGDSSAYSYFDGAEHDEHVIDGWFSAFDYQR